MSQKARAGRREPPAASSGVIEGAGPKLSVQGTGRAAGSSSTLIRSGRAAVAPDSG